MAKSTRTRNVYINSVVTLGTNIAQILLGFVIRKLFINYLGVSYLGYNSVFVNILQMLNLADMGIGVAVTSYLYKPLATGDKKRIIAIMSIYKRLYSVLGVAVLIIGLIISLFLDIIIPDANCGIWYLRILFYINLLETVSTYFLAYKRTLLVADQKSYLTNIVDTIIYFVTSGLQIASLVYMPNYIVYLLLSIIRNIISNIIVSIKVNKDYKYINNEADKTLVSECKFQIGQYVKDVFVSRIGAVVYYSTDNIILSVIKGSMLTGFLSNYTMITGHLNTVVTQVLGSIQATFANYISMNPDINKQRKMTENYLCVNFCIGNFCMICFSILVQPFVKIFFGGRMLLGFSTVLWLGINLMLTFLIQLPSQIFVIYRLFRYDRVIILVSAILNIMISVLLTNYWGIDGVLVGTFVTSLIYLFCRFYIICKYVYEVSFGYYVIKLLKYGLISASSFGVTLYTTNGIIVDGFSVLCIKAIWVIVLAVLTTGFLLCFTEEFSFLVSKLIPLKYRKYINRVTIGSATIIFIIITMFTWGKGKS